MNAGLRRCAGGAKDDVLPVESEKFRAFERCVKEKVDEGLVALGDIHGAP